MGLGTRLVTFYSGSEHSTRRSTVTCVWVEGRATKQLRLEGYQLDKGCVIMKQLKLEGYQLDKGCVTPKEKLKSKGTTVVRKGRESL